MKCKGADSAFFSAQPSVLAVNSARIDKYDNKKSLFQVKAPFNCKIIKSQVCAFPQSDVKKPPLPGKARSPN